MAMLSAGYTLKRTKLNSSSHSWEFNKTKQFIPGHPCMFLPEVSTGMDTVAFKLDKAS